MNKKVLFVCGLALTMFFSACNKNLTSLSSSYFKTTPNPLEAKAGKVDATVTGTFPQKYFSKNAVVTVTPIIRYSGGEVKGKSTVFQGEKVLGNDQTIAYKAGGTYKLNPSFIYTPEMAKSELFLNFAVAQKSKKYKLPDVKVADGVNATSQLVSYAPNEIKPAIAPDNFIRVTKEQQDADILFLIQQAQLRKSELDKEDIKKFNDKVKEARI